MIQWKPLNVIMDNVIIWLMVSNWPSPKSLLINFYIQKSDIMINTLDIVISFFRKKPYLFSTFNLYFNHFSVKTFVIWNRLQDFIYQFDGHLKVWIQSELISSQLFKFSKFITFLLPTRLKIAVWSNLPTVITRLMLSVWFWPKVITLSSFHCT